jgi:nucleoside 2-deoxyribosyltransferase
MEIGYAFGSGKEIYAMNNDRDEVCRDVLYLKVCPTKEALLKELQNV